MATARRTVRSRRGPIAIAVLALAIAACGGSTAATTTTTAATTTTAGATTTTAAATTTTAAATTTTAGGGATLAAVMSDLGPYLVAPNGLSLYLRVDDTATHSNCGEGCTSTWPPFTEEVTAGAGVDGSLLGTLDRGDGSIQVTYNGWPLYYYAGDQNPSDTNGQGLGGIWFLVDPNGDPLNG